MAKLGAILARPAVFACCLAALLLFGGLAMPRWLAGAAEYTPQAGAFDTSPWYTPGQAVERARAYTAAGRAAYVRDRWTYDLAFPAFYGAFMLSAWSLGLSLLARSRNGGSKPPFGFLAVPLAGIAFDLLENTSVTALLSLVGGGEPDGSAAILAAALASSAATSLKWLFVGAGFAGALILPAAGWLKARSRGRNA